MAGAAEAAGEGRTIAVSVVVPAYAAEASLGQTLASLEAQTHSAWEAIVVDDASPDTTPAVAAEWSARDPRIRLVRRDTNGGVAAARNDGIAAATHAHLLFLDADDRIEPGHLERLTQALARSPGAAGAYTGFRFEDLEGRLGPVVGEREVPELFRACASRSPFAIHQVLIAKEAVTSVGGFDPVLRNAEDWDLWARLGRAGARLVPAGGGTAVYRLRPGSASAASRDHLEQGLLVIDRLHGPDPRVTMPLAAHAAGLPAADRELHRLPFLLFRLGAAVAGASETAPIIEAIDPAAWQRADSAALAHAYFNGLHHGTPCLSIDVARAWQRYADGTAAALDALGQRLERPDLPAALTLRILRIALDLVPLERLPLTAGPIHAVRLDLDQPLGDLPVPQGVEVVRCYVLVRGERVLITELLAGGTTLPAAFLARSLAEMRGRALARHFLKGHLWRDRRLVARLARLGMRKSSRQLALHLSRLPVGAWGGTWSRYLGAQARLLVPGLRHAREAGEPSLTASGEAMPDHAQGAAAWEELFAAADPWGYDSAYEQTKYRQTVALLEGIEVGSALELACAEGHFTRHLAPCVDELLATDISQAALDRAAERCAGLNSVSFRRLDLKRDTLPGRYDLIVCSEVLYYLDGYRDLQRHARRIADHLVPGGRFLTAHANLVVDDPDATGFDWNLGFGAKAIMAAFAAVPGLVLEREVRTPLYRIGLFRKGKHKAPRASGARMLELAEPSWPESARVAGRVNEGGAALTLSASLGAWRTTRLPILIYHRIATDGPAGLAHCRLDPRLFEAQLAYLKRHGYRGLTLDDWQKAQGSFGAVRGRAVILTFDDGYQDFADTAWPLLKRYGFPVTMFLVTDRVGGRAEWDVDYGEPAPLMSWDTIRRLKSEGVVFGAHSATHPWLTTLGPARLRDEAARPAERMHAELGATPPIMAYPYGDHDRLVRNAMAAAGYRCAVTTVPEAARYGDDPLALPRITVPGGETLERFIKRLGEPERAALWQRARYRLRRWQGRPA